MKKKLFAPLAWIACLFMLCLPLTSCSDDDDDDVIIEGNFSGPSEWEDKIQAGRHIVELNCYLDGRGKVKLTYIYPWLQWDNAAKVVTNHGQRTTVIRGTYTENDGKYTFDADIFLVTYQDSRVPTGENPLKYEWWRLEKGDYDVEDGELDLAFRKATVENPDDTPDFDSVDWLQRFGFTRVD